jgi:hypothetical protein
MRFARVRLRAALIGPRRDGLNRAIKKAGSPPGARRLLAVHVKEVREEESYDGMGNSCDRSRRRSLRFRRASLICT